MCSVIQSGERADSEVPGSEGWLSSVGAFSTLAPRFAEVAQLVERNLAKVEVAGSSPVFRSRSGLHGRSGSAGETGYNLATWPSG